MSNTGRYLRLMAWVSKRYRRGGAIATHTAGAVPTRYTVIEQLAWSRYMGDLDGSMREAVQLIGKMEGWGSVSGGGEAVQACPRSSECGMSLPDALLPPAVVAPAAVFAESRYAALQDRIWSSNEMREVGASMAAAAEELGSGKEWCLLALEIAKAELLKAVALIETMEGWAKDGE